MKKNEIISLVGRIEEDFEFAYEKFGEKFYRTKIRTERLSRAVDILPVIIPEKNIIDIKKGDKVSIEGQFRSRNAGPVEKRKLELYIFATAISASDGKEDDNKLYLNGFICKEPNYRETPLGRQICDLTIAVNRESGTSDYIPCVVWGRNARYAKKYLAVGDHVELRGRIQSREYRKATENGIERKTAYELSVSGLVLWVG